MYKTRKMILLIILVIMASLVGIALYHHYIWLEIYKENSSKLLATYEQVNRNFKLFSQRNWNVLSDWDGNLQYISDADDVETVWSEFAERKNNWNYGDFYMFNEECDFLTAAGRKGTADNIQNVFQQMYELNQPVISDYTASSGLQKVVFAVPLSVPFVLDNTTYTGVAVSYDIGTIEDMIAKNVYGDKSSCYLVNANGNIILSLETQSEFLNDQDNLLTYLKGNADFIQSSFSEVLEHIQDISTGSAEFCIKDSSYYLVCHPVGFNDWSIIGIVQADVVNYSDEKIMFVTITMISAMAVCLLIVSTRLATANARFRLKKQKTLHQVLTAQKEQTDQLFWGMTQIIDHYAVGDLKNNRYEYHGALNGDTLYPEIGSYQDLIDAVTKKYVVLSDTDNIKMSHLLSKEYLQKTLRKGSGILKVEYGGRTENVFKILNVIALEWNKEGIPEKIIMISQDLGEQHELENLANTDGLTGLFNERYFSSILHKKEIKKLPFVLYYLDLDHFKPVNDTYGHDMGDKLLKEVAKRLLECIRNNDYVFRIGGDEFALIISADMEASLCEQTKTRIVQSLLAPYEIDGRKLHVGASCGYAVYPKETDDTRQIRILADQRMYVEKEENHRKFTACTRR